MNTARAWTGARGPRRFFIAMLHLRLWYGTEAHILTGTLLLTSHEPQEQHDGHRTASRAAVPSSDVSESQDRMAAVQRGRRAQREAQHTRAQGAQEARGPDDVPVVRPH